MKYLIVQDWKSTHGNHAGMVHMCKMLIQEYPSEYSCIIRNTAPINHKCSIPYLSKIVSRYILWQNQKKSAKEYRHICQQMFANLKAGDSVFLLEYCWKPVSQYELACYIRKYYPKVKIFALSHMTPVLFEECKYSKTIRMWSKPVDKMLTLGSSLSSYFEHIGIPKEKISTGVHYVDDKYYHAFAENLSIHSRPVLIVMGSMKRDYKLLDAIVRSTPNVDWIICRGRNDVAGMFQYPNVALKGYMSEEELKEEMLKADLSVNVMIDTVGSNVITTSMACGNGMIVSDVGSIRDYVDESNGVFCKNTVDSFTYAINQLANNPFRVKEMRLNSLKKVEAFKIERIHAWFCGL